MIHPSSNRSATAAIILTATLAAACIGQAGAAEKKGAAPAAVPALKVLPTQFSLMRSRNWNEAGMPTQDNYSISLRLAFMGDASGVSEWSGLILDKVVTEAGETLKTGSAMLNSDTSGRVGEKTFGHKAIKNSLFETTVRFEKPAKPLSSLKTIEGHVDLVIMDGPVQRVECKSLAAISKKPLKVAGLADPIKVSVDPGTVRLEFPAAQKNKIQKVEFTTANGTAISTSGQGNGEFNGVCQCSYDVALPNDACMILSIVGGSHKVTVPFSVKDVRLPE